MSLAMAYHDAAQVRQQMRIFAVKCSCRCRRYALVSDYYDWGDMVIAKCQYRRIRIGSVAEGVTHHVDRVARGDRNRVARLGGRGGKLGGLAPLRVLRLAIVAVYMAERERDHHNECANPYSGRTKARYARRGDGPPTTSRPRHKER